MLARVIEGFTRRFVAPKGWDDEGRPCHDLHVREVVEDGLVIHESAWEPTPAELAALLDGGSVVLRVVGGQPPVSLYVEFPNQEG